MNVQVAGHNNYFLNAWNYLTATALSERDRRDCKIVGVAILILSMLILANGEPQRTVSSAIISGSSFMLAGLTGKKIFAVSASVSSIFTLFSYGSPATLYVALRATLLTLRTFRRH